MSGRDPARLTAWLESEALASEGLEALVGKPPLVLEIGFGRAELLIALAGARPERAFLGVEVSRKRVAKAARRIERHELANAKVVHATAEYLLERVLPGACVSECWINFPDPWPKKRHWKRRLFQPAFLARLERVLAPGARLYAATDHAGYAEWIDEALRATPGLANAQAPERWSERRPERPATSYEEQWLAEGRRIAYFEYVRRETP